MPFERVDPELRFFRKIRLNQETGCWEWVGYIQPHTGYAIFYLGRDRYAHRSAYRLFAGPIPDGLEIDHTCAVRHCVNPAHLEAVTRRENNLRSSNVGGVNFRKTHCKNGHEFTPANTVIGRLPNGNQRRWCLECKRKAGREYQRRNYKPRRKGLEE